MAPPSSTVCLITLTLTLVAILTTPTQALTCTSQNLTNNKVYANCTDLPHLKSYLHYTYNATNTSLSIAFIAPPSKPDGWVSWAINPNGTGMVGGQSFIAFKVNGTLTVETYDIVSYRNLTRSKLSFDTWDVSAESNSTTGDYTIYASVKVPAGSLEKLNHIWQVGPSITDGKPAKHDFDQANLQAKGTLELAVTPAAPNGTNNGSTSPAPAPAKNAGSRFGLNLGVVGAAVAMGASSIMWI